MQKLYYQFPETWFGDCMPFGHGDKFYLYHQRDTRKPGPFGEPFGWDLATTSDFVHYEDCGVAIPRGTDEEQDQFIFAGSVFEAEGQYHIFYTGYNRDYPALGKPSQVLMHTKEYHTPGIDDTFREILTPMIMAAIYARINVHLENVRKHPMEIRRYYHKLDY